jgi:hypothetical protein
LSELEKSLRLDRVGIGRIVDFSTLRTWLAQTVLKLEKAHRIQRDVTQGSTAAETPNWFIREATIADVTASQARAVGNLIVENKTTGTKHEFEAS